MTEKNPSKFVSRSFCDERFGRIGDKLDAIDRKVEELRDAQRQRGRDWRSLAVSIASGSTVAVIAWILSNV